ncbi:L-aspartate oxidase [Bacillus sp. 03113]|uniref:L-aspartate oxidase n=1 Tax=Bacillus sp. 03113 TaxID=2578211 RepID=UPI001143AFC0|nr:L-aspartate oxidase [Bacillus sp. 03113]
MKSADVIIVGSGVAALQLSKRLRSDLNVIIITKSNVQNSNSYKAQGGIAAAIGEGDDYRQHADDTLEAGRFHNDPDIVIKMTKEAPALIKELVEEGCPFDQASNGLLMLGMEGAHRQKRIVHGGGDATGQRVIDFYLHRKNKKTTIIENMTVFELLVDKNQNSCFGVNGKNSDGQIESIFAPHVVIATGGCGQVYSFTSNAETVTGDGIALAYRAGAAISDMEFVQFHPTLLYVDGKAQGLVSEAVRGEGARLVSEDLTFIMDGIHPQGDLAPRHVVSQTIYQYIKNGQSVYLDISSIKNFQTRFPTVTQLCESNGIDLRKNLIPVAPGSHFLMGGIETDLYGKTNILGLYAIGEAACTGIHGANRLASNSLLEGLFFGKNLASWINLQTNQNSIRQSIPLKSFVKEVQPPLPDISELKERMMEFTGIVRTKQGLERHKKWLEQFQVKKWLEMDYSTLTKEEITKVFMLISSWLITSSALDRTESRGGHFRADFPYEDDSHWLRKKIDHKRHSEKDGKNEQIKATLTT